ncbi:MAG TPA: hypothetical protein VFV99_19110 [Kofleriaceae bacterium]|nr:hypothetical protein [Kofleriaceae bacterium]
MARCEAWLFEGNRLVRVDEDVILGTTSETLFSVRFVPMTGEAQKR